MYEHHSAQNHYISLYVLFFSRTWLAFRIIHYELLRVSTWHDRRSMKRWGWYKYPPGVSLHLWTFLFQPLQSLFLLPAQHRSTSISRWTWEHPFNVHPSSTTPTEVTAKVSLRVYALVHQTIFSCCSWIGPPHLSFCCRTCHLTFQCPWLGQALWYPPCSTANQALNLQVAHCYLSLCWYMNAGSS